MKLQEFIDKQSICPICNSNTQLRLGGREKQILRYEDNNLLFKFRMHDIGKIKNKYNVGYSVNPITNCFHVEFYATDNIHIYDSVSSSLLNKFKDFHKNVTKDWSFSKKCERCKNYKMSSAIVNLDYRNGKIADIDGLVERFFITHSMKDKFRNFLIVNQESCSNVCYWDTEQLNITLPLLLPPKRSTMTLPIIEFTTPDKLANRLNNLIIFS